MKKYILISGLAILGLTVSCTNDQTTTEEPTTDAAVEATIPASDEQLINEEQPVSEGQPITSDPTAAAPVSNPSGAKLNPAHGEPGHRCEVAVGAPLPADGAVPAQQPTQTIQTGGEQTPPQSSIMNAPSTPAPAPASSAPTAAGMNPPHGEPGHDCAIPVGSPLKK